MALAWDGLYGLPIMVSFWAIVVFLIVWAVRFTSPQPPAGSDAFRILDERCARGEIDLEEYEERRRVLRTGGER